MNAIIGYLVDGYMAFGIFLVFWAFYLDQRLKKYVDINYPEQGRIVRSYEWQWFPRSLGRKTLRTLIKKQGFNDSELARRAKKTKRSWIYFNVWFVLASIMFFIRLFVLIIK